MKILRTLRLLFTGDSDASKLFDHSLDASEEAESVVAEQTSGILKVAAGAVAAPLSLGGVTTARTLLIASSVDLIVRLNNGAEDITVKAATSGRGVLYLEGAITAVEFDNPGAADASVLFALAGV